MLPVYFKPCLLQALSEAPRRTFRSSEAEASKDPSSFQHTRLTQPSWPSNRCSTDNLRAKASLYDDHLSCNHSLPLSGQHGSWLIHQLLQVPGMQAEYQRQFRLSVCLHGA